MLGSLIIKISFYIIIIIIIFIINIIVNIIIIIIIIMIIFPQSLFFSPFSFFTSSKRFFSLVERKLGEIRNMAVTLDCFCCLIIRSHNFYLCIY